MNLSKNKWFILVSVVCLATYRICTQLVASHSQLVAASIGNKDIDKDSGRYVQFYLKGDDRPAVLDTKGGSVWLRERSNRVM